MSKNYLFFVFDYCDKITNKRQARTVRVGKSCNLKSIIKDFDKITNQSGQAATLETIAYMESETKANETATAWNNTYSQENRLF